MYKTVLVYIGVLMLILVNAIGCDGDSTATQDASGCKNHYLINRIGTECNACGAVYVCDADGGIDCNGKKMPWYYKEPAPGSTVLLLIQFDMGGTPGSDWCPVENSNAIGVLKCDGVNEVCPPAENAQGCDETLKHTYNLFGIEKNGCPALEICHPCGKKCQSICVLAAEQRECEEFCSGVNAGCSKFIFADVAAYDYDFDGFLTATCPLSEYILNKHEMVASVRFMLGDCDDYDHNVNPVQEEVCNDAVDNNCDGRTDIGSSCGCSNEHPIPCGNTCCLQNEVCDHIRGCVAQCTSPASVACGNECCPDMSMCRIEENNEGCCLLPGYSYCEGPCKTCPPGNVCHDVLGCICAGCQFCESAPTGFCEPGFECTGTIPPCRPIGRGVFCDNHWCPRDYTCRPCCTADCRGPDGLDGCLAPGYDFCGCDQTNWECGPTFNCASDAGGCVLEGTTTCSDNTTLCDIGFECVMSFPTLDTQGWACCPHNTPIWCGEENCCEPGSTCITPVTCDDGWLCMPGGAELCGEAGAQWWSVRNCYYCPSGETCWRAYSSMHLCRPDWSVECSDWICRGDEVCGTPEHLCCPQERPNVCGDTCCRATDTCFNDGGIGVCIPDGGEYCGRRFAGPVICDHGWDCCRLGFDSGVCMPEGQECFLGCRSGNAACPESEQEPCFCEPGYKQCGRECIPVSGVCCDQDSCPTWCPAGFECGWVFVIPMNRSVRGCCPAGYERCYSNEGGTLRNLNTRPTCGDF